MLKLLAILLIAIVATIGLTPISAQVTDDPLHTINQRLSSLFTTVTNLESDVMVINSTTTQTLNSHGAKIDTINNSIDYDKQQLETKLNLIDSKINRLETVSLLYTPRIVVENITISSMSPPHNIQPMNIMLCESDDILATIATSHNAQDVFLPHTVFHFRINNTAAAYDNSLPTNPIGMCVKNTLIDTPTPGKFQ